MVTLSMIQCAIMETWFIYALASAVFAGVHIFSQKVAVERGHSSIINNTGNVLMSAAIAITVVLVFFNFNGDWKYGLLLGLVTGVMHIIGSIFRMDSLKYIDTAIFFPLYKTVGPIFTLILGIIFFSESFSFTEWVGILFGMAVPILLLSRGEKNRQSNLFFGLILMLLSALFTAVAAGISKYAVDVFESIFVFMAVSQTFGAITGVTRYFLSGKKKEATIINKEVIFFSLMGGVLQFLSFSSLLLAFKDGGLAIIYTVNSFYILIPIVLSVIVYKEHWSIRKSLAIILSITALVFLR